MGIEPPELHPSPFCLYFEMGSPELPRQAWDLSPPGPLGCPQLVGALDPPPPLLSLTPGSILLSPVFRLQEAHLLLPGSSSCQRGGFKSPDGLACELDRDDVSVQSRGRAGRRRDFSA